jgi:glucan 1,3-beta-glucosidase
LLTGPVAAFAVATLVRRPASPQPGLAERTAAALLTGSAVYVVANEGIANWQALWFAGLLLILAVTALWARPAPD